MSNRRDLEGLLASAATARRSSLLLWELLRGSAILLAAWLLAFLLDGVVRLPGEVRILLLVLLGPAGVLLVGWRVAVAAKVNPGRAEAARLLETRADVEGNPFIDAVLLEADARDGHAGVSEELTARVVEEAQRVSARVDPARVKDHSRLRRAGIALGAAAGLVLLAGVLLPGSARREVERFLKPFAPEPEAEAVAGLSLDVVPGDVKVVAGSSFDVRATAKAGEAVKLPADADVECATEDGTTRRVPMAAKAGVLPTERRFETRVEAQDRAFRYRVIAGEATTRWYRVEVVSRPEVLGATARLAPPAYTGRKPEEGVVADAGIAALVGTEVTLSIRTSRPVKTASLSVPGREAVVLVRQPDKTMSGAFTVGKGGALSVRLVGEDGVENPDARLGTLTAVEDALPTVRLEAKAPNLVVLPGEAVDLPVKAEDDIGLARVRILGGIEGETKEVELWTTSFPAPGPAAARERPTLVLDPAGFEPGRTYRFVAEAEDFGPARPGKARSAPVLVRVRGPQDLQAPPGSPLAKAFERLRALVEAVRAERGRVATLVDLYDEHVREGRLARRVADAVSGHEGLPPRFDEVARVFVQEPTGERAAKTLLLLKERDLARVLDAIHEARMLRDPRAPLSKAKDADDLLIAKLLALLGELAAPEVKPPATDTPAEAVKSPADRLSKLAEDLKKFLDEQRKIVEATKEVEKKTGDDLTAQDDALLGKLAAQEAAWAKLFEEAFTDLSKVPTQDFSDSKLLSELNQVYMEVQKAADALQDKKVEIAVPAEQSGLELAQSMETNIERWIPDTKDHEKWVMEEPPSEMDVPLADLPSELEDIVGDLLDDEEKMDDSVEDVSSSWMDSIDKGAGWDATDGPISNMSAKGITGNRLPNQNEIGGRSGEGRSGKSHGQMVGDTAEGKGGRETPTRKTDDPYEAGSVKDSSRDPRGGSTGGGKVAGQGDTGLRGAPPPPVQAKLERLRGNQGELRQQAERIQRWLRALHLPSADVDAAIANMKRIEEHLASGQGFDLRQAHADVKDALETARKALAAEADTLRATEAPLSPEVKREVFSGLREPAPPGLEEVMRAYYEALARGGRQGTGR